MKKKTIYILTLLIIIFCVCNYANAEEKYSPYPIVFVHGLGGSYIGTWSNTLSYFQQNYFEGKYFVDNYSYLFPPCDYSPADMDLLEYPVARLKTAIDRGIDKGFPQDYQGGRKVIVVAHSMGGLVVQAFLKKYSSYQNKISRVLFAGTPHKGSPLASAYSLANEEVKKIDEKIEIDSKYAENVLGYFHLGQYIAYQGLLANMKLTRNIDNGLIGWFEKWLRINPNDAALKQLRVPANVSSQITVTDGSSQPLLSEVITVGHRANGDNQNGQSDTKIITYDGLVALAPPEHSSILKGTGGTVVGRLVKVISNLQLSRTYSGFPSGNALSDLATGDGVVTQYSQTVLSGSSNTISKYVWHLSEPNEKQAILSAIDDPPQIERIYAVPCDWNSGSWDNYYIVVKVKEYLLADVEIQSITLNDDYANIDLSGFSTAPGDPHKPYIKFGKDFLRERSDPNIRDKDNNIIPLKPGEFYVKAFFPYSGYGSPPVYTYDLTYRLNIMLKNPAGKTKEETILIGRPKASCYWSDYCIDVPPYSEEGDLPASAAISRLDISSGSSSSVHVKACMCESGSSTPFLTLKEGNVSLHYNGDFYEAIVEDYASWSGSDGRGGTAAQEHNYSVKINIYPYDIYAKPIEGDYKLDIPAVAFPYNGIIRADPTFIQTHRSYSRFARFDTLRRFKQYGYSLNPMYLDKRDKTVREKIDSAISDIVSIEDSFDIEKEKIIAKARSLSQNRPFDFLEDKVFTDLIEQLTKDKEMRISAIMENINSFVSAALVR